MVSRKNRVYSGQRQHGTSIIYLCVVPTQTSQTSLNGGCVVSQMQFSNSCKVSKMLCAIALHYIHSSISSFINLFNLKPDVAVSTFDYGLLRDNLEVLDSSPDVDSRWFAKELLHHLKGATFHPPGSPEIPHPVYPCVGLPVQSPTTLPWYKDMPVYTAPATGGP